MIIPELLYSRPFLKDTSTTQIEIVSRSVAVFIGLTGASVYAGFIYLTPPDRFFVLSSYVIRCFPLSAVAIDIGELVYANGGTNFRLPAFDSPVNVGASGLKSFGATSEVWIPPSSTMAWNVTLAAVGDVAVEATIQGVTIPRGNIALG
jgi:hypothetical protein